MGIVGIVAAFNTACDDGRRSESANSEDGTSPEMTLEWVLIAPTGY